LLSRCSATWATPLALFVLGIFFFPYWAWATPAHMVLKLFPRTGFSLKSPDLCLLSGISFEQWKPDSQP
jgi:hypothetical protein